MPDIQPVAAIAAKVPADVRTAGITVASSADTPPMTYVAADATTIVGLDVDMAHAVGKVLGVKTDVQNVGFDTIIPGLAANRYTMALSSMGVTAAREKTVDFVSYYNGGQGFLASATTNFKVSKLEDLCGKRVAVGKGTVQQTTLEDNAQLCADAGLKPFQLQPYPDLNQSVLAIKSDRSDVLYGSISIIGYTAEQDKSFRIAGVYKRALVGAAFPKGSKMVPVVQEAIQHLIDDGTYTKLLTKWGLQSNGLSTSEINSAA